MKGALQFGVVVVVLLSWLAPAMVCMTPGTGLSPQERACCRMMKDQCGRMGLPSSHGCCQKNFQSSHQNALQTKPSDIHPGADATTYASAVDLWNPVLKFTGSIARPESSPPQSPPGSIPILRI